MTDKPVQPLSGRQSSMFAGVKILRDMKQDDLLNRIEAIEDEIQSIWTNLTEIQNSINQYFNDIQKWITEINNKFENLTITVNNNTYNLSNIVADDGIDVTVDGSNRIVSVDIAATTPCLEFSADPEAALRLKVNSTSGLEVSSDGVALNIKDNRGLQITSSELDTKLHTSGTYQNSVMADSNGLYVNFKTS